MTKDDIYAYLQGVGILLFIGFLVLSAFAGRSACEVGARAAGC
jgi:hypothetical protein